MSARAVRDRQRLSAALMSEEAPAIAVTLDSNTPRLSTRRRATLPTQPATISITKPTPTRGSVSKTDVLPSDTSELVTPPLKSAGVTEPPSRRRRLNVNPASEPVPSEIQSIGTSYFAAVQTPVINAVPVSNASTTESVPIVDSSTEPASTASVAVPSPVSQPPTVCIAITSTATNPPNSTPLSSQRRLSYSLATSYQEEHKQNVYCVAFNHLDPALSNYFASVGHNCCTIYECMPGGALRPHCVIRDPETREYFYCVAWSIDRRNGIPLLCVAGQSGAIRIIDCHSLKVIRTMVGHGNAVNELRVHPRYPELIITASKDESVRLWNILTGVCVFVFAGEQGHRDQAITCDVSPDGALMATGGVDNTVKIWNLNALLPLIRDSCTQTGTQSTVDMASKIVGALNPNFKSEDVKDEGAVALSLLANTIESNIDTTVHVQPSTTRPRLASIADAISLYPPSNQSLVADLPDTVSGYKRIDIPHDQPTNRNAPIVHYPLFSTAHLHRNYVDCVRFYGDLIVSKSTEEEIVLWQARRSPWGGASATDRKLMALKLATFKVPKCDVWFIRFALCPARRLLAVGTVRGELLLIDLASAKTKTRWYQLKNCVSTVRGIAFNHDGSVLIAACDDGALWRLDCDDPKPK